MKGPGPINQCAGQFQIRRVLVAVDFSPPSRAALAFAVPLLRKFGAELHLVHVVAADVPLAGLMALPLIVPEIEVERRIRSHLKEFAAKEVLPVRPENIHAVKGRPFEEICRLARELEIDLIITGTRGQTGLKHLVLGSTAERVVRHAPCPVLVLHSLGNSRRDRALFRKILVPVDFSRCSAEGVAVARALAKEFDSKLFLLHSIDLHYYSANSKYLLYDYPPLLAAAETAARQQMKELVAAVAQEDIAVDSTLENGHVGEQICVRARELRVDLIVTSTHGRTGVKHALLGSTAEYVVRHASCPVLVVPSRVRARRAPAETIRK
ncbi:MAG: universal stress protein [Chthoniobacterales bacterium]